VNLAHFVGVCVFFFFFWWIEFGGRGLRGFYGEGIVLEDVVDGV
jgi:hypothetical protein